MQYSAETFNAAWRGQPGRVPDAFLFVSLGRVHQCLQSVHCAVRYEQHFAALSNTLGQLYPRPSEARSLSPLNLPNYASHQLFSHSVAVIPQPHTLMCCLSFSTFSLSLYMLSLPVLGFISVVYFLFLFSFYFILPSIVPAPPGPTPTSLLHHSHLIIFLLL